MCLTPFLLGVGSRTHYEVINTRSLCGFGNECWIIYYNDNNMNNLRFSMGDGFKKLGPWLGEGGELLFKWETWIKAPFPLLTQLVETIEGVLVNTSMHYTIWASPFLVLYVCGQEGELRVVKVTTTIFVVLSYHGGFLWSFCQLSCFFQKIFLHMNKEMNGKACNYILYFFDQTPQLLLSCCTFLSGYWFLGSYYLVSIVADKFFDEPI